MQTHQWRVYAWNIILLTIGTVVNALSVIVFLVPFDIAPGGVSGIAVILNHLLNTPIGLMVLLGNIPILFLAHRMLGGWQVIAGTVFVVLLYSAALDVIPRLAQIEIVSEDRFLNALFGGIIGGVSGGLIYRAGATLGGTSTLARILQQKYGIPLSSSALYTDLGVYGLAGLVFGWEAALYAIVVLFVAAAASDYVLEGPSVIRTAFIITDHPQEVAHEVIAGLGRGVTAWDGTGMFTDQPHTVLFITVSRPQVNRLRRLVLEVDPAAFIVVGQGHVAYGKGFRKPRRKIPAQKA